MMWQLVATAVYRASFTDWLLVVSGLLLILYIAGTWNYDYFQKRGIPASKPKIPFLGDMAGSFSGTSYLVDQTKDHYKKGEGHGVFGLFEFTKPTFIIRDPELLKAVTVKEFDYFANHRGFGNDPIFSKNLANLKDQAWREMRATLSPAFTTSKIKVMLPLISECGHQMVKYLRQKYESSDEGKLKEPLPTDMRNVFSRMANDVIATSAFGVGCDSLNHPENEFYRMAKTLTSFTKFKTILVMASFVFPKLMKILGFRFLDEKATTFFTSLVHDTIREREEKSIFRPDVLQLLMQAREGKLKTEEIDKSEAEEVDDKTTRLTKEDISAQAIIFFFAGFETVSTALCLTSHVLSHHPEEQKRLREEIEEILERTGGKLTYETLQGMKYLDAVVNEALRLYPPAAVTDRMCGEDFQLPASEGCGPFTVRKGQVINIPIIGFHSDSKYWDNPEKFDPDRFSDENKHKIRPFTYMPFGIGPRFCIAQRFAILEVKTALVHLLSSFELLPSAKTKNPLVFAPGLNLVPSEGFWCELKPHNI